MEVALERLEGATVEGSGRKEEGEVIQTFLTLAAALRMMATADPSRETDLGKLEALL